MAGIMRMAQQSGKLQQLLPAQRLVGGRAMTTFDEKERGEERVFFNREERRLLEKLLKKAQADAHSQGPESGSSSASGASASGSEEAKLKAILGSDAKPGVIASLLAWKRDAA